MKSLLRSRHQRKNMLIISCCLWFSFEAYSQTLETVYIDSVLSSINRQTSEEKIESYYAINKYINKQPSEEKRPLFKYALSKDSTDLSKMILYTKYGQNLSQQGLTDEALKIKLAGLELAERINNERFIIEYNVSVGNAYLYQNFPDKALFYFNTAQSLSENGENDDFLWNIYYHKGLLQNVLGDIDGQTIYYLKMWNEAKNFENTPRKRFVLYVLIDFFAQLDKPLELAKFTEILAELYEEAHPNTPAGHMPIKDIFSKRADPKNIPRLKQAIKISDSINSINSFAYNSIALADTYVKMNQAEKGIEYLESVERKLHTVNKPQILLDIYSKLSSTSIEASNFKDAYNYKIKETTLRDSVTTQRMQRNIAELEVQFDTEKKERQLVEKDLTIEKKSKLNNQILLILGALGVISVLAFLFFRNRLKYQRTIAQQREDIQQQKITDLQQKNKLLAMSSMIEGQEAERLRIAKDLHDSLGGLLSTVKAHFSTIQKEIEQLEQLNLTGKTNDLIDEACLEVRRISHNMMPHALSISGLKGTLEDMGEHLNAQGFKTTVEINGIPEEIESTKEVMVYRLVQEIVSNIRKHAAAKNILIQLFGHKNELTLIVEDDGSGFVYKEALDKGGLGLKSINSRVEFLDGTIQWDSQPNKGTSITINIPVK